MENRVGQLHNSTPIVGAHLGAPQAPHFAGRPDEPLPVHQKEHQQERRGVETTQRDVPPFAGTADQVVAHDRPEGSEKGPPVAEHLEENEKAPEENLLRQHEHSVAPQDHCGARKDDSQIQQIRP